MKKVLLGALIGLVVAAVAIAAYVVFVLLPKTGTGTLVPVSTGTVSGTTATGVTPPAGTTALVSRVQFSLDITGVTGSGLSRTVTAQVSNTGTATANNVWANVEAFVQGARINVNGASSLRIDVGTMNAGATVTKQATLQFGIIDSARIVQNGAHIVLTVNSNEATQVFSYDYKP